MKRYNLLLIYFFLFSLNVNAQTATDYYPFDIGNYWIYNSTEIGENVGVPELGKTEIECIEEFNSQMAYRLKSTAMDENKHPISSIYEWFQIDAGSIIDIALGATPEDILVEWDPPPKVLAHNCGRVGATWKNKMEVFLSDNLDSPFIEWTHNTVVSTSETVKVPAGAFENCIKVQRTVESGVEESRTVTYSYYAPNVGEVLSVQETLDGTVYRRELIDYSVGMK